MGKIRVEVCLISARGLRRTSSLWKLQWFVVGWIDPNNKYCSKIDASGNANPTWKTKFSALIDDDSQSNLQGMSLHVEVYSREPIFLREKLQGTATVLLKEFIAKFKSSEVSKPAAREEEVGSFQLRRKNSNKPQGFIDVSIRIFQDGEGEGGGGGGGGSSYYSGNGEGFKLSDHGGISLATEEVGPSQTYPSQQLPAPLGLGRPGNYPHTNVPPYAHPMPFPANYSNLSSVGGPSYPTPNYSNPSSTVGGGGPPSYRPSRTPPPPPPPTNVGYLPTFLPRTEQLPQTYVNLPSSGPPAAPGRAGGPRPGFAAGVGAGALAAGAVIFGDDFMSGFDYPTGLQGAGFGLSIDSPF